MRLLGRRDEFFGQLRSCAEEILFHLLDEELLRLRLPGLEPIFIEQHLGVLGPHAPRFSAYVFINLLTQFGIEGAFIQAGKFASQLCAFDHTRHENIVTRGEGELGYCPGLSGWPVCSLPNRSSQSQKQTKSTTMDPIRMKKLIKSRGRTSRNTSPAIATTTSMPFRMMGFAIGAT